MLGRILGPIVLLLALVPSLSGDTTSFGPVGPPGGQRYEIVPPLLAQQGMRLRVIETVDGMDPNGFDLWQFEDRPNVRTLRRNDIPWVNGADYDFALRYAPPQIELEIL